MTDMIDRGLALLKTEAAEPSLDGLEAAVWKRIDSRKRGDIFRGHAFQVQLAMSCAALLVGLVMAELVDSSTRPFRSETAVLSDDSLLAPSVRLEGGA
jgi:hypothetical protein